MAIQDLALAARPATVYLEYITQQLPGHSSDLASKADPLVDNDRGKLAKC